MLVKCELRVLIFKILLILTSISGFFIIDSFADFICTPSFLLQVIWKTKECFVESPHFVVVQLVRTHGKKIPTQVQVLKLPVLWNSLQQRQHWLAGHLVPAQIKVNQETRLFDYLTQIVSAFVWQLSLNECQLSEIAFISQLIAKASWNEWSHFAADNSQIFDILRKWSL